MDTANRTTLYTVKDAADRLGISLALCYALIAARRIRHERHGLKRGKILIPEDALEEYRRSVTVDQKQATVAQPQARPGRFTFLPPQT